MYMDGLTINVLNLECACNFGQFRLPPKSLDLTWPPHYIRSTTPLFGASLKLIFPLDRSGASSNMLSC